MGNDAHAKVIHQSNSTAKLVIIQKTCNYAAQKISYKKEFSWTEISLLNWSG